MYTHSGTFPVWSCACFLQVFKHHQPSLSLMWSSVSRIQCLLYRMYVCTVHIYITFMPDDLCTIAVASKPAPGWAAPVISCGHMNGNNSNTSVAVCWQWVLEHPDVRTNSHCVCNKSSDTAVTWKHGAGKLIYVQLTAQLHSWCGLENRQMCKSCWDSVVARLN